MRLSVTEIQTGLFFFFFFNLSMLSKQNGSVGWLGEHEALDFILKLTQKSLYFTPMLPQSKKDLLIITANWWMLIRYCSPFAHCWLIQILMTLLYQRLPICTRLTEPNMKPLLAVGHRSMPWADVMETLYKWLAFIVTCWNMVCLLFWGWFCEGLNFIRMNDISCSSKLWFGGCMEIIYGNYVVFLI